jgi:hypothetical protein
MMSKRWFVYLVEIQQIKNVLVLKKIVTF